MIEPVSKVPRPIRRPSVVRRQLEAAGFHRAAVHLIRPTREWRHIDAKESYCYKRASRKKQNARAVPVDENVGNDRDRRLEREADGGGGRGREDHGPGPEVVAQDVVEQPYA